VHQANSDEIFLIYILYCPIVSRLCWSTSGTIVL